MAAKVRALQAWCKAQCEGYRDVSITNMTSSWKSGLAFCAIIHRYRPDLIDYDSLSKENVFENNQLAFEVAERELNIPALLDAEDMVAMAVPDKLCVVTYVSQYYNHLANKEKLGGPGVKGKTATKRPRPSGDAGTESKKALTTQAASQAEAAPKSTRRGSSLGDLCAICRQKVYVMERHMDGSRLYHRRCIREQQRSLPRKSLSPSPATTPTIHTISTTADGHKALGRYGPSHDDRESPGKENRKPAVTSHATSQVTSLTTTPAVAMATTPSSGLSSSNLFTKVHSAPKPYTSAAVSTDLKTPLSDFSLSKSSVPSTTSGYSSIDLGLSENKNVNTSQNKPAFKAHFYGKKEDNPLLKPLTKRSPAVRAEPMDTTSGHDKNDVIGHVVNPTPRGHAGVAREEGQSPAGTVVTARTFAGTSPMTANVTRTPVHTAGDAGSDSQVLQGLLKNLAGVRNRQNGGAGIHTDPSTQVPGKAPEAGTSRQNNAPEFTKVVLKHTPKPEASPTLPKRPSPSPPPPTTRATASPAPPTARATPSPSLLSPTARAVAAPPQPTKRPPATEKGIPQEIPKPKQRHSKLIADPDKVSPAPNGSQKSQGSPKPILKRTEISMDTSSSPKHSPRPILKTRHEEGAIESEKRIPPAMKRSAPPTPPLSVFKSNEGASLLSSVQLDSSGEFDSELNRKDKTKRPFVVSKAPPRPNTPPVGVIHDVSSDSKAVAGHVTAKGRSSDDTPKAKARIPQEKTAWQIELEARQGIRQHDPKRTAASHPKAKADPSAAEITKPEWQLEAERRQAQRKEVEKAQQNTTAPVAPQGAAPVAPPRRKAPPRPSSPPKVHAAARSTQPTGPPPDAVTKQPSSGPKLASDSGESPNHLRASVASDDDPFGRTSKTRDSGGLSRKPAFRADDTAPPSSGALGETLEPRANGTSGAHAPEAPSWVAEAQKRSAARNGGYVDREKTPYAQDNSDSAQAKRKIIPDKRFTFSYDFEAQKKDAEESGEAASVPYPWGSDMRNRPLPDVPTFSPPKRKVNAEERMAMYEIIEQLEHLDAALQILEHDGRALEDKIRLGTEEEMDDGVLMVQWFELVNQKNELVRKETDLMFKKKQQELEDEHEDIEYELRCLLEKPEHAKTPSEKVREESLLQELMDTVSLRNSIVDTIEENRIKYIEEDREIAQVMAMGGFCKDPGQLDAETQTKNGKKKNGKKQGKDKGHSNGLAVGSSKFY